MAEYQELRKALEKDKTDLERLKGRCLNRLRAQDFVKAAKELDEARAVYAGIKSAHKLGVDDLIEKCATATYGFRVPYVLKKLYKFGDFFDRSELNEIKDSEPELVEVIDRMISDGFIKSVGAVHYAVTLKGERVVYRGIVELPVEILAIFEENFLADLFDLEGEVRALEALGRLMKMREKIRDLRYLVEGESKNHTVYTPKVIERIREQCDGIKALIEAAEKEGGIRW